MEKYIQLEIPFDYEEFKDIEGYEGLYKISSYGRVFSVKSNKFLKPKKEIKDYLRVALYKDGKQKFYSIHRLVATTFIPNILNLPQINHKDENPSNNHKSNLEWCDSKYNNNYGSRTKKAISKMFKHPDCGIKQPKVVLQFTREGEFVAEYPSLQEAERATGINHSNISQCCKGNKGYSHVRNYIWRYKSVS